jgi:hypothetical protein
LQEALLLSIKFHDYTYILLAVAALGLINFIKALKKNNHWLVALIVFLLSLAGGIFTSSDLSKTGKIMNNIDTTTRITRDTVLAIKLVSDKTFNLTDTIRNIDTQIRNITKSIYELNSQINNFITGDDSYPKIAFEIDHYGTDSDPDIVIYNIGKYPLHGLSIKIIDEQLAKEKGGVSGANKLFTWYHDEDEVANRKIIGIGKFNDWKKYKMQVFDITVATTNGRFFEKACVINTGISIACAYWVLSFDINDNKQKLLKQPTQSELQPFLIAGFTKEKMFR